jgi:MFS family permease
VPDVSEPESAQAERPRTARYREVFAVGEFRALFGAYLVSIVGDQLARVALSILVFDRTRSAAWTALTYAMTFLPDLIGGPLLAGIADRRSRRAVMVTVDLCRAGFVAVLVIGDLPLWLVAPVVALVQVPNTLWNAARAALLPEILAGDRYPVGQGVVQMANQSATVLGFATGGVIVGLVGPHVALALDAGTFALSAILVRWGVRWRSSALSVGARRPSWWRQMTSGVATVWTTLSLRALVALACLGGITIAAEALAAPYAAAIGAGSVAVGLLFAVNPLGSVVGMVVVNRLSNPTRLRWMVPMAVMSCALLIGCVARLDLTATLVLWGVAGVGSAYNLTASVTFVQTVPDERRAQAFGLAQTSIRVTQGLGTVIAGAVAQAVAVHLVVAAAGAVGTVAAGGAGWWWYRSQPRRLNNRTSPATDGR